MTTEIINIILMALILSLLGCILYVGYKLDETNDKLDKLEKFVYGMDIIQSKIIERICTEDNEVVDEITNTPEPIDSFIHTVGIRNLKKEVEK